MPRCVECSETYSDQLRRCPHCGATPELPSDEGHLLGSAGPAPSSVPAATLRRWHRQRTRVLIYMAFMAVLSVAAVVWSLVSDRPEVDPAGGVLTGGIPRAPAPDPAMPSPLPSAVTLDPLEESLEVVSAILRPNGVEVSGRCSPRAVVRVHVDGAAAVLSPDGSRFKLRVPFADGAVVVVGEGVDGRVARRRLTVTRPETGGGPVTGNDARVTSHADGQTVHAGKVRLAVRGQLSSPAGRELEVETKEVVTSVPIAARPYTLYRAPEGLVYLRTTPKGQHAFLRAVDNQEMVLVPAGLGWRGFGKDTPDGPRHVVLLRAYLMDRAEVTCSQYAAFLRYMQRVDDASLRHRDDPGDDLMPLGWTGASPPSGREHEPVRGLTWFAAHAYARWVGGRLPTEAEWERAAAGPHGLRYPWGDEFDAARCRSDGDGPLPADSLRAGESPYSLLHMCGNVREWCGDRFDPRWYLRSSRVNPRGPLHNRHRVIRGGSFASEARQLRLQHRDHGHALKHHHDVGFRVVIPWVAFD